MEMLKVEGFTNLRKDPSNGGVVNVDRKSYEAHQLQKRIIKNNQLQQQVAQDTVTGMQSEINNIKNDLSDIRDMLELLLQR
jgi:hypothetical protein